MAEVIVGEDALATVARREVRSAFNGIVEGVSQSSMLKMRKNRGITVKYLSLFSLHTNNLHCTKII